MTDVSSAQSRLQPEGGLLQLFRLADIVLLSGGGVVGRDEGLTGYVLGGASMQWPIRTSGRVGAGPLVMRAQSHLGPIETSLAIQRR